MFIAVKMARLQYFTTRVKSAQQVATTVGPLTRCLPNRMLGATGVSDSIDGYDRSGGACFDNDHMLCRYVMTESETLMMFFAGTNRPTKV